MKVEIIITVLVLHIYLLICVFQFCEIAWKKRTALGTQQKYLFKSYILFWYSRKKMLLIISLQSLNHEGKERPGPTFWVCILEFGEYWHFFSSVKMRSQLKIKVLKMNKTSEGFCGAYPVSTQTANNIPLLSLTLLNLEWYNSVVLSSWYRTLSQHAKSQSYCQWIPSEVFHWWGSKTQSGRGYFSRAKWRCDHSSSL